MNEHKRGSRATWTPEDLSDVLRCLRESAVFSAVRTGQGELRFPFNLVARASSTRDYCYFQIFTYKLYVFSHLDGTRQNLNPVK